MISLLLIKKIASLFIILIAGFVLVKLNLLKTDDSAILSKLCVYLIYPANMLSYFCMEATDEVKQGLLLAFSAAFCICLLYAVMSRIMRILVKANPVEEMSFCYSNVGNLIVPIVLSVLGPQWVVYCSAYIAMFHLFNWSHGVHTMKPDEPISLKKIFLNLNIICVCLGILMLFTGYRPPELISDALSDLSYLIGPFGMLITGMLIAAADWKQIFANKRIYLVIACRMFIFPMIVLLIMKVTDVRNITSNAYTILLVSFLGACAPSASTIVQMAQIYGKDAVYASAINIITTLCAIITMPIMVYLYEII